MDTLVIVRKIREAEALADSGKHGEARKLLEPLLGRADLTESHKSLVAKKIEVFVKQHERATRVLSRRVSAPSEKRDPSDDTDMGSGRKPAVSVPEQKSSGDTTVERPAVAPGAPTEALPRPREGVDKDTTKLRKRPEPPPPKGDTTLADRDLVSLYDGPEAPKGGTTVKDRPAAASDKAKPASERRSATSGRGTKQSDRSPTAKNGAIVQVDTDVPTRAPSSRHAAASSADPRHPSVTDLAPLAPEEEAPALKVADQVIKPGTPTEAVPMPAASQEIAPVGDASFDSDEMPALGEIAPPKPAGETRGLYKALPPAESAKDAAPVAASPSSVRVQDSYIAPLTEMPPTLVEKANSARSSKDLTSMVERLPDDDLRKELALEVVRLREELEKAKSGRRDTDRTSAGSSRRIAPGEKPESSIFKIPSNRVNTIVRTAAGTSEITAHMPTRDENVPELHVLRRDSLKKKPGEDTSPSRIVLAQDYIEKPRSRDAGTLRLVATALGLLAIAGLVGWAIYWAVTIVSSQSAH